MKNSFSARNFVKSVACGIVGITSIFGISPKSEAATVYPVVNNQVVRFELSNGVALNLQKANLVNDAPVYSYTGNNNDTEQHFKVISNGDAYNFQLNGTGFSISSSTLTPTNGSPMVKYQSGFGRWQDFWLDDAPGNGYYLMKWRNNPNYCVNIPGSASNVRYTLFTCNATDNDQRFRIVTVGGTQNYARPLNFNTVATLENELGHGLTIPSANNSAVQWANVDYDDPNQKIEIRYNPTNNLYGFVRGGTSTALSTPTLDPATAGNSTLQTYTYGEGRWMNFGFVRLSNGKFFIKWAWDPRFCVAEAEGVTPARIMLLPCDSTKKGMVWNIASRHSSELFLFAKQTANTQLINWSGSLDVGHANTAIVPVIGTWENGNKIARKYWINMDKISTYSAWPSNECSFKNCQYDKNFVVEALNQGGIYGRLASGNNWSLRRQRITESSVANIDTKAFTLSGCGTYGPGTDYNWCTCVDQATRLWKSITSEDFTPVTYFGNTTSEMSPNVVYRKINDANNAINSNGYANNGQAFQIN
jgi:hypothetical protein